MGAPSKQSQRITQPPPADAEQPVFPLALAAIDACLANAPGWLSVPAQRQSKLLAIAQAECDADERSPRAQVARHAILARRHHDQLLETRAKLHAAAARFDVDLADAGADLERYRGNLARCDAAAAAAAAKHAELARRAQATDDKLEAAREAAAERLHDADQLAIDAGDDEAALANAGAEMAAARAALTAAERGEGADAELAIVQRRAASLAEGEAAGAARALADARQALKAAELRREQVNMDRAIAGACDRIAAGLASVGAVGAEAADVAFAAPWTDVRRVPIAGDGLRDLLRSLYSPDYQALNADLAQLPATAAQPRTHGDGYDALLTKSTNRNAGTYPPLSERPGERRPSVTYSDPERAAIAARVRYL